ncbi:MAG TPA: amidohydrolase family protein [Methylomirabilota bacterium]|nr:amidohydrolase family protein [Methylomirabilota bacterium]
MDLSAVPILDQHCHALLRDGGVSGPAAYARFFTESRDPSMHAQHAPETVFYRWAIRELAGFLGCAPTTEAVLAARAGHSADALAHRLLGEANIAALLVDHGYRTDETWPPEELATRVPCRVSPLLRLETLAQSLIIQHETLDAVLDAYSARVERARADGFVGLKSIIAYRTGLAVQPVSRSEAAAAFGPLKEKARREGGLRLAAKPLTDYLLVRALEIAARHAMPVQIHTGFGDADLDLREANPLHLRPLLENGRYASVPFVLLHASYPYVRELGYLAAIYPNVHADVGLAIPHLAAEIPTMLRQLLSLAPSTKVVYSSDASQIPELFWLAARWGRRGLGTILDELMALGALDDDEALTVARRVLGGNAAKIYGLPWP